MDAEIFLTMDEAKNALCLDVEHYGIQEASLNDIAQFAGGGWPDRFKEAMALDGDATNDVIVLFRELFNSPTVTEDDLCAVFSMMFWGDVQKTTDPKGENGVSLSTGLENFVCLQCGQCCTNLDYSGALTPEDVVMWKAAGRLDILAWVAPGPEEGTYTIWVDPETGRLQDACPFLSIAMENGRQYCTIHDQKPCICREYPATKKHGLMTDCPGVALMVEAQERKPPAALPGAKLLKS